MKSSRTRNTEPVPEGSIRYDDTPSKQLNNNNRNVETFLSPRCNSKCKKSRAHFRYASTSTWVHHGSCDICSDHDALHSRTGVECSSPVSVTIKETLNTGAHNCPNSMNGESNRRSIQPGRHKSIPLHFCQRRLFLSFLFICTLVATGYLVRFAEIELKWDKIVFPNYAIKVKEFLRRMCDCDGNFDRVYCTADMDHFLSLYDIFFCGTTT